MPLAKRVKGYVRSRKDKREICADNWLRILILPFEVRRASYGPARPHLCAIPPTVVNSENASPRLVCGQGACCVRKQCYYNIIISRFQIHVHSRR